MIYFLALCRLNVPSPCCETKISEYNPFEKAAKADKERQYQEFKDKAGQIISGIVKRVEYGNVYLDLGKAEAYMRKDDTIPRVPMNDSA